MKEFYENEYFQQEKSLYKNDYSEDEVKYRTNLYDEKKYMFEKLGVRKGSLLDVGCGEGHLLKHFENLGWSVTGIDFSDFGLTYHNQDMLKHLIKGDIIDVLQSQNEKYDVVNVDNVLEHLPDPIEVMSAIRNVCHENTVICIRVPNDFSITHDRLFDEHFINEAFWVTDKTSEHFNYFNMESLKKLAEKTGYRCLGQLADWPIDYDLFNPLTNYYIDSSIGNYGHVARLKIENMMFEHSKEKTVVLHETLADLGVGRNMSIYLKLDNND